MAKLTIGDKTVTVGDEFLRMTPEQQNAAVEEISASLGNAASQPMPSAVAPSSGPAVPPVGLRPGTREYADWAAEQARAGNALPMVSRDPNSAEAKYDDALERVRRTQFPDMTDEQWERQKQSFAPSNVSQQAGMATTFGFGDEMAGLVSGIGAEANRLVGGRSTGYDRAFEDMQQLELARYNLGKEQNGPVGQAAEVAGSLATLGPARNAAGQLASQVIGPLTQAGMRAANPGLVRTALSSGTVGGVMGAAEGFGRAEGDISDRIEGAKAGGLAGATIGAAVPVGTAGLGLAGRTAYNASAPVIRSAFDASSEAARRLGTAFSRDRAAGNVMGAVDEAAALAGNVPIANVDRGGETVKALARSVANQNPEARQALTTLADDRFTSQAGRASDFVRRVMGGATDDIALQNQLELSAKASNRPAYNAAYNAPAARAIWTPRIRQLMQSDIFKDAINAAESAGTNQAALQGSKAVRNPFVFAADGTPTLRQLPGGGRALPSLEFWDIVQRNLRRVEGTAARSGDDTLAATAGQLRRALNGELDTAVPAFQKARQGAYEFFQAEDALDAGRKAATSTRTVPEMRAAHTKFTAADKDAASVGYASSLIDMINSARDRSNVIDQVFGNPARRELNELFLGASRARQIEAYVRVEALADKLRGTLGNSTTARQLAEMGLGGVAGGIYTGDWTGALGGAVLARGARYAGERVDAKVMEELAKLLTSKDPAALQRAISQASLSPKWMRAVEQLSDNITQYGGVLSANAAVN